MKENLKLGDFEAICLKVVRDLGEEYGVPIRKAVEAVTGKTVSVGAFYTVLSRLEEKGFVRSWEGDPTPERGGRPKRFFVIEGLGERALLQKQHDAEQMAARLGFGLGTAGGAA